METPHKTAALVTPDRMLARRVIAALARWKVPVDDSGGDALADTPAGAFARLAAEAALGGLAPISLLSLLKHPLLRLGAAEGAHARAVAALERAVLRGPRPRPSSTGLAEALAHFRTELAKLRRKERSDLHHSEPRVLVPDHDLEAAAALVGRLAAAVSPLEKVARAEQPFATLAAHHHSVVEKLSADVKGAPAAFAGADGAALATALEEIAGDPAAAGLRITPGDYADAFGTAIAGRVVRRPEISGVRVRIYGVLEARLQSADRVVLGGLVEGVWPPETRSDPWLSRPMRDALGLDLPERRISLAAHDFAQALGAREVILTGAAKLAGAPTVPSRFVQRLAAVAGARWEDVRARGEKYLRWARALDRPDSIERLRQPAPKPPRQARPIQLSVTEIEHWLRDPYTIYAKHILKLRELDPVDLPPGAADRGIVIHGAIAEFTESYARALPDDPYTALAEIGKKHFATLDDFPEARAFWWPRYLRIARWFADWERGRRTRIAALDAETFGRIPIALGERTFTLTTRADRIERLGDGSYAILDYKTGSVPTEKQVRIGVSPQLTLEAAILRRGGFEKIPAGASVSELTYVSLRGAQRPGEQKTIELNDGTPDTHADQALAKLTTLASRFESPEQPYRPLVLSMWKNRYGAYDHLARVKEWSATSEEDFDIPGAAR
jgi:ATP-dependent helicase/nuclease subunit B